ncbi:hypothetical protein RYX36_017360 [Vicia faba]
MENNSSRVCLVCNKLFSNGKALGGHMKSHLPRSQYSSKSTRHPTKSIFTPSSSTHNPRNHPIHNLRSHQRNFYYTLANFGTYNAFKFYPKYPTRKRSKRNHRKKCVLEEKYESTKFNMAGEKEKNAICNACEEKEDNSLMNVAEEKEENTQFKLVYNDFDIEAAETLVIICAKEWQQIGKRNYEENAKS